MDGSIILRGSPVVAYSNIYIIYIFMCSILTVFWLMSTLRVVYSSFTHNLIPGHLIITTVHRRLSPEESTSASVTDWTLPIPVAGDFAGLTILCFVAGQPADK